ncbi:PAS domain-containing sensor histidine kinase [Actibacterium lipolyticum]|uniref:Sensor protein FixL n=1 Tax=Actibacterium lipolyticum TaxID=1524263 RepID=A0A238KIA6_9RHOB|nr:PAS domain-containing sensor histidine kinase [Actibacterium lipolyticum]SMX42438.1 Blue-light-activated protein [Actibacterium lipolyticum]
MNANEQLTPSALQQDGKFEALLSSAVDGIIIISDRGLIQTVNPAAATLFQYDVEEFIGRNVKFLMSDEHRLNHDGYLRNYLTTGTRKIIGIGREITGRRKDGSQFPMHLSVGEFRVDGEIYFTGIIHDLTERKQAEGALRQVQKMDAIGQLTGGVAHDFNNLLTVIVGNLELLEMQLEDEPGKLGLLKEAQEAADLGARLTERLLAFARRSPLEPQVIDLTALIHGLTDMLKRTLGATVELSTAIADEPWLLKVDPAQVESAIVNLAVNARDAMPGGGRLVLETQNIRLGENFLADDIGLSLGDYVQISVTDTGSGMPKDVIERVFEPFFTTKEVGQGTGLGLSMVYGFSRQSGGHTTIYSEVGKGTTVNVYLPRHTEDGDVFQREDPSENASAVVGERILVVEDDERVRRLTRTRLESLGYTVVTAENGTIAIEMLQQDQTFDLVFTDLVMPGGSSGYDVAAFVQESLPDTRVLLTSGYAEELLHGDKLASKNLHLLRKPYRQAALAQAVRDALDV